MLWMNFLWSPTLPTLPLVCHIVGECSVEVSLLSAEGPMTLLPQIMTTQEPGLIKTTCFPLPAMLCSLPPQNAFPFSPLVKCPSPYLVPLPLMSCLISLFLYEMPDLPLPHMTFNLPPPLELATDSDGPFLRIIHRI